MKIKLALIIVSILVASCGTPSIPVNELSRINSNLKLADAKTMFEDYFDDEDEIVEFTHNNKNYTVIQFTRITTIVKQFRNSFAGGSRTGGFQQTSKSRTPFMLVFEGNDYMFSGFRYEAKINPNDEILQVIDRATVALMGDN